MSSPKESAAGARMASLYAAQLKSNTAHLTQNLLSWLQCTAPDSMLAKRQPVELPAWVQCTVPDSLLVWSQPQIVMHLSIGRASSKDKGRAKGNSRGRAKGSIRGKRKAKGRAYGSNRGRAKDKSGGSTESRAI